MTKLPLLFLLLLPLVAVVLLFLQSHQYRHTTTTTTSSTVVVHSLLIQRQQRHRHVSSSSSSSSSSKQQRRTPLFLDNNNGSTAASSSSTSSSSSTQKEKEQEWIENRKEMKKKQLEWERKLKENKERKLLSQNNFSQNKEVVPRPGILLKKEKKNNNNIQKGILNNNNQEDDTNDDYEKEDKTNNKVDNNDDNDEDDDMDDDDKDDDDDSTSTCTHFVSKDSVTFAQAHSAELIALTGSKFNGEALGVGGLEEVITEIKRRVWTPLAAPPSVLQELGVTPVRGVLLYGHSGCGKTLLARTIGKLFSPARPLTVVSGPQLMDKFVGSSEKNLRELFDNPPPVYDPYRISGGRGMDKAALHVILLDEFDAMARTRSGSDSDGGAASVARDSVVNQILSKMDGVDRLEVPTLVIAMTNRPALIDPALLRPGRFEVQIEVPPPSSRQQRISILNVHMTSMQQTGRLKVSDSPNNNNNIIGGVNNNNNLLNKEDNDDRMEELVMTYHELLTYLSDRCEGYSGAQLSAIPRAAASRALERAVSLYSVDLDANKNDNKGRQQAVAMFDCVVTIEDLEYAVDDVGRSAATTLVLQNSSSSSSSSTTSTTNDSSSSSSSSKRQQQPGIIDNTDNDVVIVPNNGRKEIEIEDEELLPPPPPPHDTTQR